MVYWYEAAKIFFPDKSAEKMEIAELYQHVAQAVASREFRVSVDTVSNHPAPAVIDMQIHAEEHPQVLLTQEGYRKGYEAHITDGVNGNHQALEGLLAILDSDKLNELNQLKEKR